MTVEEINNRRIDAINLAGVIEDERDLEKNTKRISRLFGRNGWGTRVLGLIESRKISDILGRKWISILIKNTRTVEHVKGQIHAYEN